MVIKIMRKLISTLLSLRLLSVNLVSVCLIPVGMAGESMADPVHSELTLDSDNEISLSIAGDSGDRVLWIPSEYGLNKARHYWLVETLAKAGHEVWLAELHSSYFVSPGRNSYTEIPVDDIADLIRKSLPDDGSKMFIVSTSRGSALTLLALNELKKQDQDLQQIAGLVMIHPNFQANTPVPGADIEYLSVIDTTQMPIYMIQPFKSNRYWYMEDLVSRLNDAGSQVYTQVIQNVSDGYHVRPDSSDAERRKSKQLPADIARAIQLLAKTRVEDNRRVDESDVEWKMAGLSGKLDAYPEPKQAPSLQLRDMDDELHDLASYRGRVVVLNFWATWCPPCVEEIPSLGRLQAAFSEDDLVVLSVDIGESKEDIKKFLQQIPADFPVMIDPEGTTVKPWNVIAYPTTFVIDRSGIIRLAYYGGLEWDMPEIIEQLQTLVKQHL